MVYTGCSRVPAILIAEMATHVLPVLMVHPCVSCSSVEIEESGDSWRWRRQGEHGDCQKRWRG
jgi:hypothetical protein